MINDNKKYLNQMVKVLVDRPIGSKHPKYDTIYEINYGYIENTISGDNEELDCYILGVNQQVETFDGICIAVIHRLNDNDDKLIVVPKGYNYSNLEIEEKISFIEKYYNHIIIR